ncbi:MAG TPA: nuclear transport factor 2 family protein [Steroidobacter sp.]|nr:nuclear transport factor 2 family protein [Steroidobacteraceae bacterium]HLS83003.1 nuclear transport factor 2 family protein [Steroidobacter sp.]
MIDAAERLAAIRDIEQLKARYFRCMDLKDWRGLEAVFTPDVLTDFRESTQPHNESLLIEGAARYVAMLAPVLQPLITVHHGHMSEIEITSETTATGIWAMEDKLWAPEGSGLSWRRLHGYGHYHERYEKRDGRWLISAIRLTRLRVDIE